MMQHVLPAIYSPSTTMNKKEEGICVTLETNWQSTWHHIPGDCDLQIKMQPSDFFKKNMDGNTVYTVSGVMSALSLLSLCCYTL